MDSFLRPELIAILTGVIVLGLLSLLFMQVTERGEVKSALERLEAYDVKVETQREKELSKPIAERLLAPLTGGMGGIARRVTPVGYVESLKHKMILAGKPGQEELDRALATRVMGLFAVIPAFLIINFLLPVIGIQGRLAFFISLFVIFLLILGPDSQLGREVTKRQDEIRQQLPDILDLLTISVEAGLGFEQALDRTVEAVPGHLSNEFHRFLAEIRTGSGRADALRAMERRINVPEVRSFVLAIIQADAFGVSIARVLRVQAEEMRIKRRQIAQEKAQKAPVKMLIPMVFCIFPSVFVVVLGPAIINIKNNF